MRIVNTMNEEAFYREVGKRLREQRLALKLTQEEASEKCSIKRTTLAHIEKSHQRPSLHQFFVLCQGYGVEPQTMLPTHEEVESEIPLLDSKLYSVNIISGSAMTPALSAFLTMKQEEPNEKS